MKKLAATGVLVVLGSSAFGCGGVGPLDRPGDTAVEASALGKGRCTTEGDEQRLFVVDWDATDLAAFEARAGRDVVFVQYADCKVTMLHGCSDDGIAGRFGTYGKAIATSGTVESLAVKNMDELYAKLPLGAATFGTEVSRGKALDLSYFVSGTVNATRDSVYREDLKPQDRCAEATHFVSSYALGAFSLASVDKASLAANASAAGFGGGGKTSSEAAALKKGGDMTTCTSMDPHACRVPIRLTLRPVTGGGRPTAAPIDASAASPPGDASAQAVGQAQGMMDAVKLRMSAEQKLMAGDAGGCLADLDRAATTSPQLQDPETNLVRSRCEMRAGQCEAGKKHYKEAKSAWARGMQARMGNSGATVATDASIAAEAETMGLQYCPSAATGGAPPTMAMITALSSIQRAAAAKDAAACIKEGDDLGRILRKSAADPMARTAAGGVRTAAICAGEAGKCVEARRLWLVFSEVFLPGSEKAFIDSSFKENVPTCAKP